MGTSLGAGEIRYDHADLGADRFVDTALMRDAVDTALHKADEAGQVRLHYVSESKAPATYLTIYGNGEAGALDTGTEDDPVWYLFPLRARYLPKLRADGRAYPLRVRLAGAASGSGTVDFGIVVMPASAPTLGGFWGDAPAWTKLYSGVTSTSAAWLTPDDSSNLLTIPSSIVEEAYRLEAAITTKTDIGGDPTAVVAPALVIYVLGATRTGGVVPRLYAAHAAEHVGET
jgi:hypothetical protein